MGTNSREVVVIRNTISAAAFAVLVLGAVPALADEPVAGCGADFTLGTVEEAFDAIDKRIYSEEELRTILAELQDLLDANGDGYLCWKQFKPNQGQDKFWGAEDYVITLIDDNKAVGRG
jgi:hypothetical protein